MYNWTVEEKHPRLFGKPAPRALSAEEALRAETSPKAEEKAS